MTLLFVEPNENQRALIAEKVGGDAAIVTAAQLDELRSGTFAHMRWHCGTEAAIYLAAAVPPEARGSFAFDQRCLSMLTKSEAATAMASHGIPIVPKRLLGEDERPPLPAVLKPNFGFASILVKRVTAENEVDEYRAGFAETAEHSLIGDYRRRLFAGCDEMRDAIVVEPDLSAATFLSVSFEVADGGVTAWYPVEGAARERSATSDFFWTSFSAPPRLTAGARSNAEQVLAKLAAAFSAGHRGVYHAELMVDAADTVYVVEFSPRVSGGSVPELIRAAYAADVHDLAIELALGNGAARSEPRERRCVLVRRDADTPRRAAGMLLSAVEKTIGSRRLIDEIYAEIYAEPA